MGLEDDFPLWILQATIKIWRGAYYPQILGWSKAEWGLFCNPISIAAPVRSTVLNDGPEIKESKALRKLVSASETLDLLGFVV